MMPTFGNFVVYIVRMRAKPKVLWVHALRHIASVKDAYTIWNRANEYLV